MIKNIDCFPTDGAEVLKKIKQKFDYIYVDPSRRNQTKGKVFMLKDCEPNVPNALDFYFQFSTKILIKTSPMLDISIGISELKNVKNIYCIALNNELKELLFELEKNYTDKITLKAINITKNKTTVFESIFTENYESEYSEPEKYLYEPNAAMLKAGQFEAIGAKLNVKKLHKHTHLFTSQTLQNFDGRIFKIEQILPFNKANAQKYLKNKNYTVNTRNFPVQVAELRKKYAIKEGTNDYVFFTTLQNETRVIIFCKKVD